MASILKISEAASLAIHTMVYLSSYDQELTSTDKIATTLKASHAHLSKVLQRLVKEKLISSTRGPRGGFAINPAAKDISLLQIFEVFEGPLKPECCLFEDNQCRGNNCIFECLLHDLHDQAYKYLKDTKLSMLNKTFV